MFTYLFYSFWYIYHWTKFYCSQHSFWTLHIYLYIIYKALRDNRDFFDRQLPAVFILLRVFLQSLAYILSCHLFSKMLEGEICNSTQKMYKQYCYLFYHYKQIQLLVGDLPIYSARSWQKLGNRLFFYHLAFIFDHQSENRRH